MSFDQTPGGPLPVRTKCSPAELELCACWINEHGDPAEWTVTTRLAYAAMIADARVAGVL